jgi:6-phosphogluconolactonase
MTQVSDARLDVSDDANAMADRVAEWTLGLANAKAGTFAICLSGGSTPQLLYQRLAQPKYSGRFPWARVHWFWGDERFVPPDDDLSNYKMVRDALLDHAPVPKANIHIIPTLDITPDAAAAAYERDLKAYYGAETLDPSRPLFDINFLGLGTNGHTASLFPDNAVLGERSKWVAAVVGAMPEVRITLTYPVLDSSANAAFLVTGKDKNAIFKRVREGDDSLPAARIKPTGDLWMFSDKAASAQ